MNLNITIHLDPLTNNKEKKEKDMRLFEDLKSREYIKRSARGKILKKLPAIGKLSIINMNRRMFRITYNLAFITAASRSIGCPKRSQEEFRVQSSFSCIWRR